MRLPLFIFLLVLAQPVFSQERASLADLGWLEGVWRGTLKSGSVFEARYSSPEGGVILGTSKRLRDGRTVFHEFELFEEREDALTVTPYPGGVKSVAFRLVEFQRRQRSARFENTEHDFPTELIYERTSDTRLLIIAAGMEHGMRRELRFELERQ